MRFYPILLVALAMLAGSAGYITHRGLAKPPAPAPLVTATRNEAPASPVSAENALDWTFESLAGPPRALREWADDVLVVNFWATWCPPCLREIPAFVALQQQYGEQGLQFVGVALDEAAAVQDFVADNEVNYPVLVGDQAVVRFMQQLGNDIGALPYTAVLSRHGEIRYTHQGEWDPDEAEALLLSFMKSPQTSK